MLQRRRTAAGRHPIGHIVLDVVQHASRPVVAVPPQTGPRIPKPLHRLLVPLDGTAVAAHAVEEMVQQLCDCGVQVLALHVFDAAKVSGALHVRRGIGIAGPTLPAPLDSRTGFYLFCLALSALCTPAVAARRCQARR